MNTKIPSLNGRSKRGQKGGSKKGVKKGPKSLVQKKGSFDPFNAFQLDPG